MTNSVNTAELDSRAKNFRLTERDLAVAQWIADRRVSTAEQIHEARLYPTLQKAQSRLYRLWRAGELKRFPLPIVLNNGGKPKFVYHAGAKPRMSKLLHTLAINDLRNAFEVACADSKDVRLVDIIPDSQCSSSVGGGVGRDTVDAEAVKMNGGLTPSWDTVIPDCTVCLESRKTGNKALFFCEVDLGTEKLLVNHSGEYSVLEKMLLYKGLLERGDLTRFNRLFDAEFKGFRVLVILSNAGRAYRLRTELGKRGISKFIWVAESSAVRVDTMWNSIWMIPDMNNHAHGKVSILRD